MCRGRWFFVGSEDDEEERDADDEEERDAEDSAGRCVGGASPPPPVAGGAVKFYESGCHHRREHRGGGGGGVHTLSELFSEAMAALGGGGSDPVWKACAALARAARRVGPDDLHEVFVGGRSSAVGCFVAGVAPAELGHLPVARFAHVGGGGGAGVVREHPVWVAGRTIVLVLTHAKFAPEVGVEVRDGGGKMMFSL